MGLLIALFARWGLPEWVRRPLAFITTALAAAALLGMLATCWMRRHDKQVIETHEAAITQSVAAQAASASTAAASAVAQTQSNIGAGNDEARDAAENSDDPWLAGLNKLRKGRASPAAKPTP